MTAHWITADAVFDGQRLATDICVLVDNNTVLDVSAVPPIGAQVLRLKGVISPGFVDLQVNGGGGVLVNTRPTVAGLVAVADAHRRFGTVAILPTVITDTPEVLAAVVDAAIAAKGMRGIAGLHIEGPHIALARRGTHDAAYIRPLDDVTIAHVRKLRRADIPVMLTLAPEAATPAQINVLCALGAVVSIGHTDATAAQVEVALAAGAACFTHLYNAMSQMAGRAAGVVGAAINSDAYTGMICDGIHVSDEMLGLAIRARPVPDRCFIVSDAMPTVGGPDAFELYGQTIRCVDGRLVNAQGNLAGAHVTQLAGVARLVSHLGLSVEAALRMAITVPATLMKCDALATLNGRKIDDIIVIDTGFEKAQDLRLSFI